MTTSTLRSELNVKGKAISEKSPVFIVGEIACGHQGDVGQAKDLIDAVHAAGADAVQLEFFHAAANVVSSLPFYELVDELAFSQSEWENIVSHLRTRDIAFSAFIYDDVGLEWALDLEPDFIKLNSSDISNQDLIIPVAESGIPFSLGTGASTMQEISTAVDLALEHGDGHLILQHGVQNFPTPTENAHIRRIGILRETFGALVMYADHTDATSEMARYLDLVALGVGACAVEKHVVLDRSKEGVDWQAALEPDELKQYVDIIRSGDAALGPDRILPPTEGDEKYRRFQKKTVVAARDISKGSKITRDCVAFLRAQGQEAGLSPMDFEKLAGRRALRDISKDEQVLLTDVQAD